MGKNLVSKKTVAQRDGSQQKDGHVESTRTGISSGIINNVQSTSIPLSHAPISFLGMNGSTCIPSGWRVLTFSDSNGSISEYFWRCSKSRYVSARCTASDADPAMRPQVNPTEHERSNITQQHSLQSNSCSPIPEEQQAKVDLLSWQEWQK
jgi:hypothetical protein